MATHPFLLVLLRACGASLLAGALAAWAGSARAQAAGGAAQGAAIDRAAAPAFALEVRAPQPARELLEQHLELRRYREVGDLDDTELARLIVLAGRNARELLATLGYFDPRVEIRREPGQPQRVVVEVDPGTPARVEAVDLGFRGDIADSTRPEVVAQREAIRQGWPLPAGERFTQEAWDDAKAQAQRRLVATRYLRGQVGDSLADVDAATGRVRLGLRLDSGPVFRLGEMKVTGIERYDPRLVPRLARLVPGTEYDQERIQQAQLRLSGSGYFDSAFIYVDPNDDPAAAPVQVTVREARLQRLVLGLGLTTDAGPRLSIEHRHNRVPGIGWRADTKLQLDRKAPALETSWTAIPGEDGWRWGVLGRYERLDDDDQITRSQRLRVGRTRSQERIDRSVYLQYDRSDVRTASGLPPEDTGDGTAISANYVWTGRYLDSLTNPNRGFTAVAELGGGLTLVGSRSPFQRTLVRWTQYRPLATGRLKLRAEGGAVLARGSARVPASQLFRTGGDTSVRGYNFRDIGVERAGGVIAPGRFLAVGSIEWQRPLVHPRLPANLEHTLFLDAGSVADRPGELRPRVGIGTGVRFLSPIGPLEAALAWGVKPRRLRLHLTVGVTF